MHERIRKEKYKYHTVKEGENNMTIFFDKGIQKRQGINHSQNRLDFHIIHPGCLLNRVIGLQKGISLFKLGIQTGINRPHANHFTE